MKNLELLYNDFVNSQPVQIRRWKDLTEQEKEVVRARARRYRTETPEQRAERKAARRAKSKYATQLVLVQSSSSANALRHAAALVRQEQRRRFYRRLKVINRNVQEGSAQIAEMYK